MAYTPTWYTQMLGTRPSDWARPQYTAGTAGGTTIFGNITPQGVSSNASPLLSQWFSLGALPGTMTGNADTDRVLREVWLINELIPWMPYYQQAQAMNYLRSLSASLVTGEGVAGTPLGQQLARLGSYNVDLSQMRVPSRHEIPSAYVTAGNVLQHLGSVLPWAEAGGMEALGKMFAGVQPITGPDQLRSYNAMLGQAQDTLPQFPTLGGWFGEPARAQPAQFTPGRARAMGQIGFWG